MCLRWRVFLDEGLDMFIHRNVAGSCQSSGGWSPVLMVEARILAQVGLRGICGGQSGTATGFSPSPSVFPCQYHSTAAPHSLMYLGDGQRAHYRPSSTETQFHLIVTITMNVATGGRRLPSGNLSFGKRTLVESMSGGWTHEGSDRIVWRPLLLGVKSLRLKASVTRWSG
jgi:hypothetical protein